MFMIRLTNKKGGNMNQVQTKADELLNWLNNKYGESKGTIFSSKLGKKYIKVLESHKVGTSVSVYCFIDEQGNILKPNSYKTPHKTPRGTIFKSDDWSKVCYQYGVKYINGFANF